MKSHLSRAEAQGHDAANSLQHNLRQPQAAAIPCLSDSVSSLSWSDFIFSNFSTISIDRVIHFARRGVPINGIRGCNFMTAYPNSADCPQGYRRTTSPKTTNPPRDHRACPPQGVFRAGYANRVPMDFHWTTGTRYQWTAFHPLIRMFQPQCRIVASPLPKSAVIDGC